MRLIVGGSIASITEIHLSHTRRSAPLGPQALRGIAPIEEEHP